MNSKNAFTLGSALSQICRFAPQVLGDVMGKQLLRSGTSILANYVEANSASSKKDFINSFTHSLKSANESKVWLCIFKDLNKGNFKNTKVAFKRIDRNIQRNRRQHINFKRQNNFTFFIVILHFEIRIFNLVVHIH